MTVDQGPRPVGTPRSEAVNQYAHQVADMKHRIELHAMDAGPIPMILGGLYFVEIDLVSILAAAAKAEQEDPEPQCGHPVGPSHCVKVWRHKGDHWIIDE